MDTNGINGTHIYAERWYRKSLTKNKFHLVDDIEGEVHQTTIRTRCGLSVLSNQGEKKLVDWDAKPPKHLQCKTCARIKLDVNDTKWEKQVQTNDNVELSGSYHDGLVYCLGYHEHGDAIELCDGTFTNINTGLYGGAMAALTKHRKNFDPSEDVPRIIVALKPVKILVDIPTDEDYSLNEESKNDKRKFIDCEDNGDDDDDYCPGCDNYQYCCCDEFDNGFIADTFRPMNAFSRARWLKACEKI